MSRPRFRAWRFAHPTPGMSEGAGISQVAGLQLSPTGGLAMAEGHASVRQSILLLLSTSPGERVMRPDSGCELHRLVFSPNDASTAGLAIHYVRRALERWEPRVEIVRLDAGRGLAEQTGAAPTGPAGERDAMLDILLEYRLRTERQRESLVFSIALTGETA